MSATITRSIDAVAITPDLVFAFEDASESASLLHPIIGSSEADVTLRPARRPTGQLKLFFLTHDAATAAREFHRAAATYGITSDSMPWLPARYVPQGPIGRVQEEANRTRWTITVAYQELAP